MRITRAAKVAAFPLTALVLVALIACQGPAGPAGAAGAKGDTGASGSDGAPGPAGIDAPPNMPPTLKADKMLNTEYLALANAGGGTAGSRTLTELMVSTYFEDPEGVTNLHYSLGELSDADKKTVDVYLNGDANTEDGDTDPTTPNTIITTPVTKASVEGDAYLAIMAKASGSVTLKLTVKDGTGGSATFDIGVMVRASNAPPTLNADVLTTGAEGQYSKMSRTGAMRLRVQDGPVTVMIPDDAFRDADVDDLTIEAVIGGADAATITANEALLGATIDSSGNLVLTPKKGGTATIPVILRATDPYMHSVETPSGVDTPGASIQVEVNVPPMHKTYENDNTELASALPTPAGRMGSDKAVLADLAIKTFSIAVTNAGTGTPAALATLANHFVDLDSEDNLIDADLTDGYCDFTTSSDTYATVEFNDGRTAIQLTGKKMGSFDVVVTCTDTRMETLEDKVTVTIVQ